jgi:hypothetical protein
MNFFKSYVKVYLRFRMPQVVIMCCVTPDNITQCADRLIYFDIYANSISKNLLILQRSFVPRCNATGDENPHATFPCPVPVAF